MWDGSFLTTKQLQMELLCCKSLLKNFSWICTSHTAIEKGISANHTAWNPLEREFYLMECWLRWESELEFVLVKFTAINLPLLHFFGVVELGSRSREGKGHHVAMCPWVRPLNSFWHSFCRRFVKVVQAATSLQLACQYFYCWSTAGFGIEMEGMLFVSGIPGTLPGALVFHNLYFCA